jgi:hypothetical protein
MKERPILFSGEMVRAILEGRKTQTRRVIKDPICTNKEIYADAGLTWYGGFGLRKPCKFGAVGDRLWVKEDHYAFGHWEHIGTTKTGRKKWAFEYDSYHDELEMVVYEKPKGCFSSRSKADPAKPSWYKRNSLFMPRWAYRITREIASVRVERLQDITEEDAKAEGTHLFRRSRPDTEYRENYKTLWEKINGAGSWDANPWVWVVEFKKVEVAK